MIRPILFLTFILAMFGVSRAYAGGGEYDAPESGIDCYRFIPTDLHPRTGWKPVEAADRHRVGNLVSKGKAKWQRRQTLLCIKYDATGMREFVASEYWWK